MKKIKKIIFSILILGTVFLPNLSFAATTSTCSANIKSVGDVICEVGTILNSIIPILMVLGVLYFVWGVVTYVIKDDEEAKKKGRNRIIYGILGLVVIVGLWGIVTMVIKTFGFDQTMTAITNPADVVNTSTQAAKASGCYSTYIGGGKPKLGDLLTYATCIIGASVIPLLFIFAVASFIWGVVQFVINDSEESKKAKGRNFMIWGIIALAVMVSVWGLVGILENTFGINNVLPTLKSN